MYQRLVLGQSEVQCRVCGGCTARLPLKEMRMQVLGIVVVLLCNL